MIKKTKSMFFTSFIVILILLSTGLQAESWQSLKEKFLNISNMYDKLLQTQLQSEEVSTELLLEQTIKKHFPTLQSISGKTMQKIKETAPTLQLIHYDDYKKIFNNLIFSLSILLGKILPRVVGQKSALQEINQAINRIDIDIDTLTSNKKERKEKKEKKFWELFLTYAKEIKKDLEHIKKLVKKASDIEKYGAV